MTESTQSDPPQPVWARDDAFPLAPRGYGWMGAKGRHHILESHDELVDLLSRDDGAEMLLIWTPDHKRMMLPEALAGAGSAMVGSKIKRIQKDLRMGLMVMGGVSIAILVMVLMQMPAASGRAAGLLGLLIELFHLLKASTLMGVALLVWLIFGFIPWYQAWKRLRELRADGVHDLARSLPVYQFETWLEMQRAPVTQVLAGVVAVVALMQWLTAGSIEMPPVLKQAGLSGSIWVAGLVKPAYHHGEWWRLFTAPLLHGNVVHFIMNFSALLYLGKRVELFARWPHLLVVFVFSSVVGGVCSAYWLDAPSVGASGGLLGWLGFLLVFESLHRHLVPRSAKRRLLAGLVLTGVIGVIGYRFIDNAAHIGGAVAGMAYALIVFPPSASNRRPYVTTRDRFAGSLAAIAVLGGATIAVWLMLTI